MSKVVLRAVEFSGSVWGSRCTRCLAKLVGGECGLQVVDEGGKRVDELCQVCSTTAMLDLWDRWAVPEGALGEWLAFVRESSGSVSDDASA